MRIHSRQITGCSLLSERFCTVGDRRWEGWIEMIDADKIKEAVRLLLEGIGEDPDREGLAETPDRVARMYGELFSGMDADPAEIGRASCRERV